MHLTNNILQKCKLENAITKAIMEFERETELIVSGISIERMYMNRPDNTPVVYAYEIIAEIDGEYN